MLDRKSVLLMICTMWLVPLDHAQIRFSSQAYSLIHRADQVAIGDLNGDNKPDLAVLDIISGTVAVLVNNGDGTFTAPTEYSTGTADPSGPTSFDGIAIGDLNDDGKNDVLLTHTDHTSGASSVQVLLGNGDGTLKAPIATTLALSGQNLFGVADLNGDRKLDLAVYAATTPFPTQPLVALLGNGDGTFAEGSAAPGGSGFLVNNPMVADLNGDKKPDVFFSTQYGANEELNRFFVFLGNGDGTFQPAKESTPQAPSCYSLALGDFNGDSIPDLVSASAQTQECSCEFGICSCRSLGPAGSLALLLGNGDGTFGGPGVLENADFSNAVAADFDGDGNLDFAVLRASGGTYLPAIYLGDGHGKFAPPATVMLQGSQQFRAADLNGDGIADIIAVDGKIHIIYIQLNTTPGFSLAPSSHIQSVNPGESAAYTITVAAQNGFKDPVTFTCSAPEVFAVNCSVSPSSVIPGNPVTVVVATSNSSRAARNKRFSSYALFLAPFALIWTARARAWLRWVKMITLLAFALVAGVLLQSACGGGHSKSAPSGGTPVGTYAVSVSGSSGSLHHTIKLTLSVQ